MAPQQPTGDLPGQPAEESFPATATYPKYKPWLLALALLVVTFMAYQPTWHAGFIWDDDDHVTANPAMTAPDGLRMIWSSLTVSRYYPLTLTTFWMEHRLWGFNPLPYHLVNVALHAINGLLVFLVLRRLRVRAAWLAAVVWVLHPVNVESVAWITELKNIQSGFFFFAAILCFLRFDAESRRRWYALALACGLAAMLSKTSTVVLPLVLLLCVWWQRSRWRWTDILRTAPFFAMALVMSALTIIEQRGHIARTGTTEWKLGIAQRLMVASKAVWFYAAKLLWPSSLTFIYPRWNLDTKSWLSWVPLAGLLVAGLILWKQWRRPWARASLFGFGYFLVALLPVLGFIDVFFFRFSFVADHFQYLASIGVIACITSGASAVFNQDKLPSPVVGNAVCAGLLITLAGLAWMQCLIYHDSATLWRDTLAKNPNSWMVHNNLGAALSTSGKLSEAIEQYQEELRLKPEHADAHYNIGNALLREGQVPEAIEQYNEALKIRPDDADAHYNLGNVLSQLGRMSEAIEHYQEALRLKPYLADAHYNLGNALLRQGNVPQAIAQYKETLQIDPEDPAAHYNLGTALEMTDKVPEAVVQYRHALRVAPDFVPAKEALARLQASQ